MGHIYLSHSHPIAIVACPVPSHPMGRFPWDSHRNDIPMDKPRLSMGHIYLSHSHPIAIYACPIPWDVSHGIPMDKPAYTFLIHTTNGNTFYLLAMWASVIACTYRNTLIEKWASLIAKPSTYIFSYNTYRNVSFTYSMQLSLPMQVR